MLTRGGLGPRHSGDHAAAGVRHVRAGRPRPRTLAGRPRHRPGAGEEAGRDARRQRPGRERGREPRLALHRSACRRSPPLPTAPMCASARATTCRTPARGSWWSTTTSTAPAAWRRCSSCSAAARRWPTTAWRQCAKPKLSSRPGGARHRPAGHQRPRGGAAHPPATGRSRHAAGGGERLGPGRRSRAFDRGRLQPSPGQAGGHRGAAGMLPRRAANDVRRADRGVSGR